MRVKRSNSCLHFHSLSASSSTLLPLLVDLRAGNLHLHVVNCFATLVDGTVIFYCSNKGRKTLLRGLLTFNFVHLPLPTPYIYVVLARVQIKSVCYNDLSVLFNETHDINDILQLLWSFLVRCY